MIPSSLQHSRAAIFVAALVCAHDGWPAQSPRHEFRRGHSAGRAAAELRRAEKAAGSRVFHGYTLHDTRTTQILASFGASSAATRAGSGSPPSKCASATITLDNTHPHSRRRARDVAAAHSGQPAADRRREADPAGAVARDRSHVQAGERSADARQDQRRGEGARKRTRRPISRARRPQKHTGAPATYSLDTKAWEARLRRISAPVCATIRSCFAATSRCRSRPTTATTSTAKARRSRPATSAAASSSRAMTKADDGMELPLYTSYFATHARRPAGREAAHRRRARDDRAARASAQGAARRSVFGPGDSVGPRRRRLLPRNLRPSRRRQPPAQRRRRADVRAAASASRCCRRF